MQAAGAVAFVRSSMTTSRPVGGLPWGSTAGGSGDAKSGIPPASRCQCENSLHLKQRFHT